MSAIVHTINLANGSVLGTKNIKRLIDEGKIIWDDSARPISLEEILAKNA